MPMSRRWAMSRPTTWLWRTSCIGSSCGLSPPAWDAVGAAGAAQQTPNLAAVVQEVVDQGGWLAANAMAFVISGAGKRVAESFDGKTAAAPLLHIEYDTAQANEADLFF